MGKKFFAPNVFKGDLGQIPALVASCYCLENRSDMLEKLVGNFEDIRFLLPLKADNKGKEETSFIFDTVAGQKALLAFTNIDELFDFSPMLRPMPILGKDLASLSLRLQVGRVLVDKGSKNILIGRQAIFCIAEGKEWLPIWKNENLEEKLVALLQKIPQAKGFFLRNGNKCETEILVAFDCPKEEVSVLVSKLKGLLSNFGEFLQATDSVEIIPFKA